MRREASLSQARVVPLLPFRQFCAHLARHWLLAGALLAVSLLIGVAGFHWLAGEAP